MDRFWSKVDKSGDCWEWTASRINTGYGRFVLSGKIQMAHRVSYELMVGPIPKGKCVLHHCDNPPCVRPDHLWVGSRSDNMLDMYKKGRRVMGGENAGTAKLTSEQVLKITNLIGKEKRADIAEMFKVSQSTIGNIATGHCWSCVTGITK